MTRYRVRIVLLAPDRGQDVHDEANRLMVALIDAARRDPTIRDVAVSSASDEGTVTVDATVAADSGPGAEVSVGSALLPLTVWVVVATSHELVRVDRG